jgi:tRNA (guanine-N7-)-methyltransferase
MNDYVQPVRPFTPNPSVDVPVGTELPLPDFTKAAVDLELGCGTGMFALDYAKQHPERHLLAIEQTVNKFSTFSRAFEQQPLPNLLPIHADGALWVDRYLPEASIEQLFILYPNPYPKKKQRNLRWHYMPAMHSILRALKPASQVLFCTNLKWLVDEATAQFSEGWKLELESVEEVQLGARSPLTLFEKKYLERGETCFDLRLRVSR